MTDPGSGSLRVTIDRDRCMGSGNCMYWAAEVFDIGDDMIAVVVGDPDAHSESVELAAENCPTHAIRASISGYWK